MLLTLTTTCQPASELGFRLHKNPERVQSFELSFGKAHVFYRANRPPERDRALERRDPVQHAGAQR